MKKKPQWFRPIDAVSFLIPIVGASAATIYAMAVGVEGPHAKEGIALCWVVVALFIAIWGVYSYQRKKALDQYRWYPNYGFFVHPGGYQLPPDGVFDGSVFKTIQLWSRFHPNAEQIIQQEVIWVFFKKDLDESPRNLAHMKVEGLTVAYSHVMAVDYDHPEDDFNHTAFEHELGHIIHGHATGTWDLAEHHDFAKKNGLR
jgi:hypothetical protein